MEYGPVIFPAASLRIGEALTAEVMLRNLTLAEHLKKH
jgi:hypothetical protein